MYIHADIYICIDTDTTLTYVFYFGKMFGIIMASCFFTAEGSASVEACGGIV